MVRGLPFRQGDGAPNLGCPLLDARPSVVRFHLEFTVSAGGCAPGPLPFSSSQYSPCRQRAALLDPCLLGDAAHLETQRSKWWPLQLKGVFLNKMTPHPKPTTLSNISPDPTKPSTEEQTNFSQSESIPETTYSDGTSPKVGQKFSQKFGQKYRSKFGRPPLQTNPQ